MPQTHPNNLLDQTQFDDYTAAWVSTVSGGNPPALESLFQQTSRLLAATLPANQLLQLVSVVGVRRIKVGFVVLPAVPKGASAFALALYATDEDGQRLSTYYVAGTSWATTASSGTPPAPAMGCGTPVPPKLANLWQQQWTAATSIEDKFFVVPNGVLQGYDFAVGDFVQALLAVPQPNDKLLRFDFGLHEYYGPDAPASPDLTRTFGLAMYLADSYGEAVSAPYDLSQPRPPAL